MLNSKTAEVCNDCDREKQDYSDCDEEELLKKKKRVSFDNAI
jgi:hypothetical protein